MATVDIAGSTEVAFHCTQETSACPACNWELTLRTTFEQVFTLTTLNGYPETDVAKHLFRWTYCAQAENNTDFVIEKEHLHVRQQQQQHYLCDLQ